jgi:hypothetical protein
MITTQRSDLLPFAFSLALYIFFFAFSEYIGFIYCNCRLYQIFIVNVGPGFWLLWNTVKSFLDPKTTCKIHVSISADYNIKALQIWQYKVIAEVALHRALAAKDLKAAGMICTWYAFYIYIFLPVVLYSIILNISSSVKPNLLAIGTSSPY